MEKIITEDVQRIAHDIRDALSVLEGKTLLITGGSGFIGSYFIDVISFLNDNHFGKKCRLICLDNLIVGDVKRIKHLSSKGYFEFIKHDISKPFSCNYTIDYIVHCAGIASPTFYRQYPIETIDVNILGTRNLLQLALDKKVKSFMYFSSSETYGDPLEGNIPTPETYRGNVSFTGPRACYDESKRLGETLCIAFFNQHNVPVKMVRPFNVYGPGMRLDDKRVIPDFVNNVLRNEPITMYSNGKDTRSFCYISDAITGFFKVLLSDLNGESFNVGNDLEEVSMLQLAEAIKKTAGNKLEIVHKDSKDKNYLKDNPKRRVPDLTKMRTLLKYEPKIDLKTGLERNIEWYKSNYNFN